MTNLTYKFLTLVFIFSIITSTVAIAKDENAETVTVDTPDSVLLENVDFSEIAKVKKPSTKLTVTVEGVPYEIEVNNENEKTVLMMPKVSNQKAELIKAMYLEAAQIDSVDIEFTSTEKY